MDLSDNLKQFESIFEELQNVHYPAGPLQQRIQRLKALTYMDESELEAIYYLKESHVPGLRTKAVLRYEKLQAKSKDANISSLSKDYIAFNCAKSDVKQNVQSMLSQLEEMPKEWSIVQLTPQFNSDENIESDIDIYYTNPLHLSVLNCGKKQMPPFCITVDSPRDKVYGNVVELAQEMNSIILSNKEILQSCPKTKAFFKDRNERQTYFYKRQQIDDKLRSIVKDLQDLWLKEWRCLLIGKYVNQNTERQIRCNLKEFFKNEAPEVVVSEKIQNLLFYVVKGCCYLNLMEIKNAVAYCFPDPEHKNLVRQLTQFISGLFDKLHLIGERKHPIILIIDDTLDRFPWEMIDVLTDESVSRVPSFHFAYALFKEHEKDIVNGYKVINDHNKGTYIVNPDLDLVHMQTRIMNFFNYWTPHWKGIAGAKPTEGEFEEMLTSGSIFSYNGHGSGSKFLSMEKIQKMHIKTVVLLFGCGSTKVSKIGPQAEMFGTYQMYLIACSPCIIGMLWEVTDVDTDLLTTEFMSCWIPSDVNIHWRYVDKQKWKLGNDLEFPDSKIPVDNANGKDYHQPELLKALSVSKKVVSFYLTKAACVARGIPVKIIS